MRRVISILAFTALFLLLGACEDTSERQGLLAIVDGVEIREEDAWELMGADPGTPIPPRIVNELIDTELILRQAREFDLGQRVNERLVDSHYQALAATDEVILAGGTAAKRREIALRERIKRGLIYDAVVETEVLSRIEISPLEIEDYYSRHRDDFLIHPVRFRQIVVEDEEAAVEARQRLTGGEDFAELAAELSVTREADNGGLVEISNREDLPAALLAALVELEGRSAGTISEPVETDWGFHLITLLDSGEARVQPLDVVEERIRLILFEQRSAEELERWIAGLRAAAADLIWHVPLEEL